MRLYLGHSTFAAKSDLVQGRFSGDRRARTLVIGSLGAPFGLSPATRESSAGTRAWNRALRPPHRPSPPPQPWYAAGRGSLWICCRSNHRTITRRTSSGWFVRIGVSTAGKVDSFSHTVHTEAQLSAHSHCPPRPSSVPYSARTRWNRHRLSRWQPAWRSLVWDVSNRNWKNWRRTRTCRRTMVPVRCPEKLPSPRPSRNRVNQCQLTHWVWHRDRRYTYRGGSLASPTGMCALLLLEGLWSQDRPLSTAHTLLTRLCRAVLARTWSTAVTV